MSVHHLQAVIEQLSADERAFFDREPAKAWLAQMSGRLAGMSVSEAAELVRAEIPALGTPKPARAPRLATPAEGGDTGSAK
jgi:hypothetical protein